MPIIPLMPLIPLCSCVAKAYFTDLVCGEEVLCDAYVSCNDGTVWLTDEDGNYVVDEDGNYIIE